MITGDVFNVIIFFIFFWNKRLMPFSCAAFTQQSLNGLYDYWDQHGTIILHNSTASILAEVSQPISSDHLIV